MCKLVIIYIPFLRVTVITNSLTIDGYHNRYGVVSYAAIWIFFIKKKSGVFGGFGVFILPHGIYIRLGLEGEPYTASEEDCFSLSR